MYTQIIHTYPYMANRLLNIFLTNSAKAICYSHEKQINLNHCLTPCKINMR